MTCWCLSCYWNMRPWIYRASIYMAKSHVVTWSAKVNAHIGNWLCVNYSTLVYGSFFGLTSHVVELSGLESDLSVRYRKSPFPLAIKWVDNEVVRLLIRESLGLENRQSPWVWWLTFISLSGWWPSLQWTLLSLRWSQLLWRSAVLLSEWWVTWVMIKWIQWNFSRNWFLNGGGDNWWVVSFGSRCWFGNGKNVWVQVQV